MYACGVFIGRFEPFHNAHLMSIKYALERCDNLVVVLGSSNMARNAKNPWSADERENMILLSLPDAMRKRVKVVQSRDFLYNINIWITSIQRQVHEAMASLVGREIQPTDSIALFGHKKDASSFYLKLFPQWVFEETGIVSHLNATDIRDKYFGNDASYKDDVTPFVHEFLEHFKTKDEFKRLQDECHHVAAYKEAWRGAPFAPTFVTVDAVVIKSGHVLVVRRKGSPGKGLIALPGGFLNQDELIRDGALRELKEETGIKVQASDLKDSICDSAVFDHPGRSLRGRTITHAFCINLGHGDLPAVKGADDAEKAWWMPLSDVHTKDKEFFEDHYHIINHFVNKF